jgi:hypothetical protein
MIYSELIRSTGPDYRPFSQSAGSLRNIQMNTKNFQLLLIMVGTFSVTGIASASSSITTAVDGRSGPWNSALNPSFNWGTSVSAPTVIDSSAGLTLAIGDTLTIHYISGTTNGGGGGIFSDANGNQAFAGDLAGRSDTEPYIYPARFIDPSHGPVYFMALLGAFTDSYGVIVGNPFKIGDGPFSAIIPEGATQLSMGFNDSGQGYFDNGGALTIGISEVVSSIPEAETYAMLLAGLGLMGFISRPRKSA